MPLSIRRCVLAILATFSVISTIQADESSNLERLHSQAQDVCIHIFLPNSMGRPDGFDINAELQRLKAERAALALKFATPSGIKFLVSKAYESQELETQLCIVELLATIASSRTQVVEQ